MASSFIVTSPPFPEGSLNVGGSALVLDVNTWPASPVATAFGSPIACYEIMLPVVPVASFASDIALSETVSASVLVIVGSPDTVWFFHPGVGSVVQEIRRLAAVTV